MLKFLRENWLWIAVPFLLVVIAVVIMIFVLGKSSDGPAPFIYNV